MSSLSRIWKKQRQTITRYITNYERITTTTTTTTICVSMDGIKIFIWIVYDYVIAPNQKEEFFFKYRTVLEKIIPLRVFSNMQQINQNYRMYVQKSSMFSSSFGWNTLFASELIKFNLQFYHKFYE